MNVFFGNFGDIYKEFDFDMVVNMVLCQYGLEGQRKDEYNVRIKRVFEKIFVADFLRIFVLAFKEDSMDTLLSKLCSKLRVVFPVSDQNILDELLKVRDELKPKILDLENTEIFENFLLNTQNEDTSDNRDNERTPCDYSDIVEQVKKNPVVNEDPSVSKAISKAGQNRSKVHKKQKNIRQKLNQQKRMALLELEKIASNNDNI